MTSRYLINSMDFHGMVLIQTIPFKIFCVLCASVFQSLLSPFSALDKNVANHVTMDISQTPLRPVVVVR